MQPTTIPIHMFKILTHTLYHEIILLLLFLQQAVDQCMLFMDMSDEGKDELVDAFEMVKANRNEMLIEEGEWGDLFYVLEQGTCDALKVLFNPKLNDRAPMKVKSYEPGGSFGELALMYNEPRAASIRVTSDKAILWSVDRHTSKSISVHFKVIRSQVHEDALRRVPLINKLAAEEMARLLDGVEEKRWVEGQVIYKVGDQGDDVFVVLEGRLGYKNSKENGTYVVGDYFGEGALLNTETRTSTVTCDKGSPAVTVQLSRVKFEAVMGPSGSREDRKARPVSMAITKKSETAHRHMISMKLEDLQTNMRVAVGRSTSPSEATKPANLLPSSPSTRDMALSVSANANHEGEIVLGVGTFGKVLIVRHSVTGETYAMKRLNKAWIVANSLEQHVVDERNVMTLTDHPFVLKLHNSYWDNRYVYLVLELCLGGELFSYLRKAEKFPEQHTRFYAASVALAFEHLHSKFIIYRDLKPENLMLDDKGFLKVVDFGLAKVVKGRTWTICGTPEYLAPEVVLSKGHNRAVDYWALGILIYELCAGACPFQGDDNMAIYKLIIENRIEFPAHFTPQVRDIIRDFTKSSQIARLGLRRPGVSAIKEHAWFSGFDWSSLEIKTMIPPIVPRVRNKLDTSNFEDYVEDETVAKLEAEESDWRPSFPFEVKNGITQNR
jgi:CRP-like cAMP-binding protein